jgi:hypothetical protein
VKLQSRNISEKQNVPAQAMSEEEIQACHAAKDGLVVVLEDLGR